MKRRPKRHKPNSLEPAFSCYREPRLDDQEDLEDCKDDSFQAAQTDTVNSDVIVSGESNETPEAFINDLVFSNAELETLLNGHLDVDSNRDLPDKQCEDPLSELSHWLNDLLHLHSDKEAVTDAGDDDRVLSIVLKDTLEMQADKNSDSIVSGPIARSLVDDNDPVAKSLVDDNDPVAKSLVDDNGPLVRTLVDDNDPVARLLDNNGPIASSFSDDNGPMASSFSDDNDKVLDSLLDDILDLQSDVVDSSESQQS